MTLYNGEIGHIERNFFYARLSVAPHETGQVFLLSSNQ